MTPCAVQEGLERLLWDLDVRKGRGLRANCWIPDAVYATETGRMHDRLLLGGSGGLSK